MPDQRLTAKDAEGNEFVLGAVQESDQSASLQTADRLLRERVLAIFTLSDGNNALLQQLVSLLEGDVLPALQSPPEPVLPPAISHHGTVVSVPASVEVDLATLLVPAQQRFVATGFTGTGSTDGLYRLYVDAAPKLAARSSAAIPTAHGHFPDRSPFVAGPGTTVHLKVEHASPRAQDFEGYLHGYFISDPASLSP